MQGKIPTTLKPIAQSHWNYTDIKGLANAGSYPPEMLQKQRHHMMFPVENPSMLNTIAMGITERSEDFQNLMMTNLFNEKALMRLASRMWERIWSRFMTFGSASAAIIGLIFV